MLPKPRATIIAILVAAATITSFVQPAKFEPHPRHHHRVNHTTANGQHQHHNHNNNNNHHHHHHHRPNSLGLSATADKTSKRLLASSLKSSSEKTLPFSASLASFNALSSTSAVVTAMATATATSDAGGTAFAAAVSSASINAPTTRNDTSTKPLKLFMSNAFDREASTKYPMESRHSITNINHHSWQQQPRFGVHNNGFYTWNYNPVITHHSRSSGGEVGWPDDAEALITTTVPSTTTPKVTQRPVVVIKDRRSHPQTKNAGRHVCNVQPSIPDNKIDFEFNHKSRDFWRSNDIGNGFSNELPFRPTSTQRVQTCCAGWAQISRNSNGCSKPICRTPCANGGKCVKPDVCQCPSGFTGSSCESDRNECTEHKPCDQHCFNTFGSYYCKCREGFVLLPDRESCQRMKGDTNAIEARDMENDVDLDYSDKIRNIESRLQAEKKLNEEMNRKVKLTMDSVQSLRQKLENVEHRQQEVNLIRDKLNEQEEQSRNLKYIVDQLYQCRIRNSIFCTLQRR